MVWQIRLSGKSSYKPSDWLVFGLAVIPSSCRTFHTNPSIPDNALDVAFKQLLSVCVTDGHHLMCSINEEGAIKEAISKRVKLHTLQLI